VLISTAAPKPVAAGKAGPPPPGPSPPPATPAPPPPATPAPPPPATAAPSHGTPVPPAGGGASSAFGSLPTAGAPGAPASPHSPQLAGVSQLLAAARELEQAQAGRRGCTVDAFIRQAQVWLGGLATAAPEELRSALLAVREAASASQAQAQRVSRGAVFRKVKRGDVRKNVYPFPYQTPLVAYSPLTLASPRMLPCRTHCPHPSMCIMYGCGTACGTTLFARFGPITLCPKPPKIDFWPTLSPYAT